MIKKRRAYGYEMKRNEPVYAKGQHPHDPWERRRLAAKDPPPEPPMPIGEHARYWATCRCGTEFSFTLKSGYAGRRHRLCAACLAKAHVGALNRLTKSLSLTRKAPQAPLRIRCLRCGWQSEPKAWRPHGTWVCEKNPEHPVIAEP